MDRAEQISRLIAIHEYNIGKPPVAIFMGRDIMREIAESFMCYKEGVFYRFQGIPIYETQDGVVSTAAGIIEEIS